MIFFQENLLTQENIFWIVAGCWSLSIKFSFVKHKLVFVTRGKSRVKLLPLFGWVPKFMKKCSKVFVNHMQKICKICSTTFQVRPKIVLSLFPSDQMLKKFLTWETKKKKFFPIFSWCSCTVYSLSVLFDSIHYVYLEWFIYIKTSSC